MFKDRGVSIASRKDMEDSEHWHAVGCIEVGQSITDAVLFCGFCDFMIIETIYIQPNSCLKTCGQSSKSYDSRGRFIYCRCSQADPKKRPPRV
ncbi:uncharacterized protein CDAR_255611 [Caerostris darwini]|uniref:Uncharacterized protein n=1 Tax=Caerostris darwini TaxID=1538125 RepID=A0AAV4VDP6_9ARAC|nr:uncharacterized protein CDAR_255611 [Caerostris darwini]